MQLRFPNCSLDLTRTRVMGVLNVTPDSFSDGGMHVAHEAAIEHALQMVEDGADIIDIGGESTRPGAAHVSVADELDRVVDVVAAVQRETSALVSVDTSKPEVMRAAVAAGASLINDVRALRSAGALTAAAKLGVPVCLMHMQGEPGTMQKEPRYNDVVTDVLASLQQRVVDCREAGIAGDQIVLDPGFGFGKTLAHNLELLRHLGAFVATGHPVLVGLSRKSMIPAVMANSTANRGAFPSPERSAAKARDRIGGSVTLALYAARKGAHIVRVHDVRETVEALTMQAALDSSANH